MSEKRVIIDTRTPDQIAMSRAWWKWIESKEEEDLNLSDAYFAGFEDALKCARNSDEEGRE